MQESHDHSPEITYFADVILPVPIPKLFTYRVPREFVGGVQVGVRVIVQFGKSKVLTAVIARVHTHPPEKYQAKYILDLLDDYPLVTPQQLELFHWISGYYLCCIGEVLNIALPAGLKISSLSKVQINPDFDQKELLSDREKEILEEINKHQSLTYDELARFAEVKNVYHLIKSLVQKRAVIVFEEVKDKYSPKIVRKIRLSAFYEDAQNLKILIAELDKPKTQKQLDVLLAYLNAVPVLRNMDTNRKGLEKSVLNQNQEISTSSMDTLLKNGVFEIFDVVMSRFPSDDGKHLLDSPTLSLPQTKAYNEIMAFFQEKDTVLLHGITGSGKTEVYIKLIEQALGSGSQVLYLLPEIALTTQIVIRLKKIFGDKVGIYHSKFSDNERVEVWKGVLSGKFQFVVGVRSSVFLPFNNLGLIIVDEEHESSYKQFDPAPRYHARDAALVIAQKQQCKVLLGSATPSVESYHHAKQGRYGLVKLKQRFGEGQLPDIETIDIKMAKKQKAMKGDFAQQLLDAVGLNLETKNQTLFFQNRRGYSPYLQCEDCDWIGTCHQCDVSLTYHQYDREVRCHYCGHKENVPKTCPACGGTKVRTKGYGTEKIEEELQLLFPSAKIARIDLDTTRTKTAFQSIVQEVESGAIDMIVGTQMVAKGLDFEKINLVCVFDADRMIHFPDFRASERAFQLITQVSGRAGRRQQTGKVLIQTNNPAQPLLRKIIDGDYEGFFEEEIIERQTYHYPPFTRLIRLTVKHIEQPNAQKAAEFLAKNLKEKLGDSRVLGPEKPIIERIRNMFLVEVLLKLERNLNLKLVKDFVVQQIEEIATSKDFKGVVTVIDVDCG